MLLVNGEVVTIADSVAQQDDTSQTWEISGQATAELRLTERDQADPAGRYRFRVSGDQLLIERAASALWATATTLFSVDGNSYRFENGAVIVGSGEGGVTVATGNTVRGPDLVTGGAGDVAGADLTIAAGLGTGTGDVGTIIFSLPIVAASGDNIHTTAARLTLDMIASTSVLTMTAAQAMDIITGAGDLTLNPAGDVLIGGGATTIRPSSNVPLRFLRFDTTFGAEITAGGHFAPAANNGVDLGISSRVWRVCYFGGPVNIGQVGSLGRIQLGATTTHATTTGHNLISIFNGTAPVGTLADGASLYVASGEMNVIDSGGNVTLLSPHDDDGLWVFHSKDTKTGRVLHVHMEKLMRRLDELLGGGFIEEFIEEIAA